jgi:drug/metabolite transporter (DMT)-like permease
MVLLAGLLWSTTGVGVRLMEAAGPWQILFYRSVFMAAAMVFLLWLTGRDGLARTFRAIGYVGVIGGACLCASSILYIFALAHTTVANTVFLLSVAPFFTALLAFVVLGERIRPITWATMLVAMVGVAVMVGDGFAADSLYGNMAALAAAACFAGLTVALRARTRVNMLPTTVVGALLTALVSGTVLMTSEWGFAMSDRDISLCLLLAVIPMCLGGGLYTLGSRFVPAAELTLLSFVEIALGPVLVWLVVDEIPSQATLAGGVIVLGAVTMRALHGIRPRMPAAPL